MNKVTLLVLTILLCSCDHAAKMQPSNFQPLTGALANAQTQTKKGEAIAKGIAANGTKPGSQESSQLLLTFQSTEDEQAQEEVQIKTLTLDDKAKTDQGNANADLLVHAQMQLRDEEKLPARDHKALFIFMILQTIACCFGPFLFYLYPPLSIIPTKLEAIACGVVSFILLSSIAGLLIAFGVL